MTTTGDAVHLRTWAGNLTYSARRLVEPESLDELRRVVAGSSRVRALGTRHSFNAVADTTGDLVGVAEAAAGSRSTPSAGRRRSRAGSGSGRSHRSCTGGAGRWRNLGSLPHISVAGAVATGTHGSGAGNRVLGARWRPSSSSGRTATS